LTKADDIFEAVTRSNEEEHHQVDLGNGNKSNGGDNSGEEK